MKSAPGSLTVPNDLTPPVPEAQARGDGFGNGMVHALLVAMKSGLEQHWAELRAIEIGIDDARASSTASIP